MQAGLGIASDLMLYTCILMSVLQTSAPVLLNNLALVVLGSDHFCRLHSVVPGLDF